MITAKEMYEYCVKNGFGSGWNEKWGIKHFLIIQNSLMNGEDVLLPFIGLHNYVSMTKHDSYFAYAITNKRIIMGQQRLIGEACQTVSLDNVNDITFNSGLVFGTLTIDTIKEVFNVGLDKVSAQRIHNAVVDIFHKIKNSNNNNNSNTQVKSIAEEIKEFKELLDIGAITQDEFDKKKKELLGK